MATPNLIESVVRNHNVVCTHNKGNRLQSSIAALEITIMTQSTASNISLQVGECQENILLPATDANAEV